MGIFSSLFGSKANGQSTNLIELTSNQVEAEGWQDLIFKITEKQLQPDGYWNVTCKATHGNKIVGFRLFILEGLEAGIVNNEIDNTKFVREAVIIEGIGSESNQLVAVMSALYGKPTANRFTDEPLSYTIFPLNQQKASLNNGYFKFKLFFDDTEERGLYSEMYLNTNFPNGTVEFNEKDPEYRKNIIKHFSK